MRAWPLPSVRMMKQRSKTSISFLVPTAKWLSGAVRRAAMTLFLCVLTTATAWADITGNGTISAPYVLSTAADWATFASNVNGGTNVDKCYKLSDSWDNSGSAVTATVGTSDHPFTGTFDGNGKTLNVSISEASTMGIAPFRYISGGAVIKNVTITGTVTGTTHAAGLVGFSNGATSESPNTIEGCTVNASVTVNTGDNKHMGGVVGHGITSYLKIKDTVFSGTMTNGGNYAGGLQGWSDGNHLTIDNCIFTGRYSGSGSFHPIAIHNAGSTTTATVSTAYYTAAPTLADAAFIAAAGTQVSASVPSDVMYGQVTAADNQTYYAPVTVSGIGSNYLYTGSEISVTYTVTAADGSVLTKGTDFAETFDPATVKDTGDYTLTVAGTGNYSGSQTFSFTVVDIPSTLSGLSVDNDYTYPSAGYFYVNMPTTGTSTVTLPDEFTSSFKVYDDGGKNGPHSNACRGTLILTAPEGYVLQLSGDIITESADKLTVYDNNEANGNKLLDGVVSSGWDPFAGSPTRTAITTVTSTGQSMTLYFYSDQKYNYAGLDLTVTVVKVMALTDNANNSAVIDSWNGGVANVTLSGRTLYKDGDWNTLCLPFGLSDITGTPLEGAIVMELDTDGDYSGNMTGFDAATGTLYLYFKDATAIVAGRPYIVKWTDGNNIFSPVFSGVTIDNSSETQARNTVTASNSGLRTVQFIGSYSPVALTPNDKSNLFLGTANTLYYPDAANNADGNYHVNACRAYFHVDLTGAANVRAFVLGFGEDGGSAGVSPTIIADGGVRAPEAWYSLRRRHRPEEPRRHYPLGQSVGQRHLRLCAGAGHTEVPLHRQVPRHHPRLVPLRQHRPALQGSSRFQHALVGTDPWLPLHHPSGRVPPDGARLSRPCRRRGLRLHRPCAQGL